MTFSNEREQDELAVTARILYISHSHGYSKGIYMLHEKHSATSQLYPSVVVLYYLGLHGCDH